MGAEVVAIWWLLLIGIVFGSTLYFAIIVLAILQYILTILALKIVQYILGSKALHQIANNRGIPNGWMIWIPGASYWAMGNLVDTHNEKLGIKTNWKKALLTMYIVCTAISLVFYFVTCIIFTVLSDLWGGPLGAEEVEVVFYLAMYFLLIVLLVTSLLFSAGKTICMYKVFESIVPEKAIKYTLLDMIVPLAGGICLWKCKDKEKPQQEIMEGTDV